MNEISPQVVLIAGPNGAGKTSLAPFLLRDRFSEFAFINADAIAAGLSAFAPETVAIEAGRVMLSRLHELSDRREFRVREYVGRTLICIVAQAPAPTRLRGSLDLCLAPQRRSFD